MKIALYELYKALKSKVLLILFVALFLLNLALSATYTPVLGVPDECIREINKVYLSTSEEEKLSVAESIAYLTSSNMVIPMDWVMPPMACTRALMGLSTRPQSMAEDICTRR